MKKSRQRHGPCFFSSPDPFYRCPDLRPKSFGNIITHGWSDFWIDESSRPGPIT